MGFDIYIHCNLYCVYPLSCHNQGSRSLCVGQWIFRIEIYSVYCLFYSNASFYPTTYYTIPFGNIEARDAQIRYLGGTFYPNLRLATYLHPHKPGHTHISPPNKATLIYHLHIKRFRNKQWAWGQQSTYCQPQTIVTAVD